MTARTEERGAQAGTAPTAARRGTRPSKLALVAGLAAASAVAVGIGFFIAFIGLKNAGIVVADPATTVTLGNLRDPKTLLATFGWLLIAALLVLIARGRFNKVSGPKRTQRAAAQVRAALRPGPET